MNLKEKISILRSAQTQRVDHLPIVSAYCRKLDLIDTLNQIVPSEMEISPGVIIQGMVLDTLSGRSPLYRLSEFFKNQDTELLLGEDIQANSFNDTTIGRALDLVYEAGTMAVFGAIGFKAVGLFRCDLKYLHFDTTSLSVWGDYDLYGDSEETKQLKITHGHSKDNRPDLKQFLIKMLCVDKNIPLLGGCEDGNTSDKAINNKTLTSISKTMARHGLEPGAYIYIADSAMVTEDNLNRIGENLFVSRLPFTYSECDRVIRDVVHADCFEDVGVIAHTKPTKNRPVASYRAAEGKVKLYDKTYRAVVVHSSAHDKRRQKRLDRELKESRQSLEEVIKREKHCYFCRQDAEAVLKRLEKTKARYYRIEAGILEKVQYGRGRPKANKPREIVGYRYEIVAQIKEKREAVERKRQEAGCFVLLTNVPTEGEMAHSGSEVLKVYKDQHGVERNFAFLKDPLIVNDLFLKNPNRIEVLGLILLISLLVWNLMERSMRQYVEQTGEKLSGWDNKPTDRPTAFMMSTKFVGVMVMKIDGHRIIANKLSGIQHIYLVALNLSPAIFTNPRPG
jgi:transposase